ncbi:PaaI family thioesterase [Paracoccaceae bacterium]|jgi:uncharacterized protein (TIGR00369 family)|nr:PaaI family thioesterase [Paracoccaceae bacterium]MDA9123510.1 PaaI family thioesterase [Paracoccaceae bacterium]|tara:strand:+ start:1535 stop:1963 length:429 start_codon:yes stop_codon:yes gene_type:complete
MSLLKMSANEIMSLLNKTFPQQAKFFEIDELTVESLIVRHKIDESHLRPGGTISGPTMFSLADISLYILTMSRIGPALLAVTTNCSMDFMRKPKAGLDLLAKTRLLKLGKNLCVGDVLIFSEGLEKPVARASMTYSIPPKLS